MQCSLCTQDRWEANLKLYICPSSYWPMQSVNFLMFSKSSFAEAAVTVTASLPVWVVGYEYTDITMRSDYLIAYRHWQIITMLCNVVFYLLDWSADISGDPCCTLCACLTPGETDLPLLASQGKPPARNVSGEKSTRVYEFSPNICFANLQMRSPAPYVFLGIWTCA